MSPNSSRKRKWPPAADFFDDPVEPDALRDDAVRKRRRLLPSDDIAMGNQENMPTALPLRPRAPPQEFVRSLPLMYSTPNSGDFAPSGNNTFHCLVAVDGVFWGDLKDSPARVYPATSSLLLGFGVRVVDKEQRHQDVLIEAETTENIEVQSIDVKQEPGPAAQFFHEVRTQQDELYTRLYIISVRMKAGFYPLVFPAASFAFRDQRLHQLVEALRHAQTMKIFVAIKLAARAVKALNLTKQLLTEARFLGRGEIARDDWYFSRQKEYAADDHPTLRFQNFTNGGASLIKPPWLRIGESVTAGYAPWLGNPNSNAIKDQRDVSLILSGAAYIRVCLPALIWEAESEQNLLSKISGLKHLLSCTSRPLQHHPGFCTLGVKHLVDAKSADDVQAEITPLPGTMVSFVPNAGTATDDETWRSVVMPYQSTSAFDFVLFARIPEGYHKSSIEDINRIQLVVGKGDRRYERRMNAVVNCVNLSVVPPPVGGTYTERLLGTVSATSISGFTLQGVAFGEPGIGRRVNIGELFLQSASTPTMTPAFKIQIWQHILDIPSTLLPLDEIQKRAFQDTLSNATNGLSFVTGASGTGKSLVLALVAYAMMRMNMKTLVCALTQEAVATTMSHLQLVLRHAVNKGLCPPELINKSGTFEYGEVRVGDEPAKLNEMLVVGALIDSVDNLPFNAHCLLLDEALQMSEVDLCVPLAGQLTVRHDSSKLHLVVLAGNHAQPLPQFLDQQLDISVRQNPLAIILATSAMKRWPSTNPTLDVHRLRYNYRQHPDLYHWTNAFGLTDALTPPHRQPKDANLCRIVEELVKAAANHKLFGRRFTKPGVALRRHLFMNVDSPYIGKAANLINPGGVNVVAKLVTVLIEKQISPAAIGVATFTRANAVQLYEAIQFHVKEAVACKPGFNLQAPLSSLFVAPLQSLQGMDREITVIHIPHRIHGSIPWGAHANERSKASLPFGWRRGRSTDLGSAQGL